MAFNIDCFPNKFWGIARVISVLLIFLRSSFSHQRMTVGLGGWGDTFPWKVMSGGRGKILLGLWMTVGLGGWGGTLPWKGMSGGRGKGLLGLFFVAK